MLITLLSLALAASPSMVSVQTHMPEHVGQCFTTRVKAVETRLVDGDESRPIANSGSALSFQDGHYLVSYDQIPAMDRSHAGDPVRLCVTTLPRRCPAGDMRGIRYSFRNLRTGARKRNLSDAEHGCGGA